MIALPTAFFEQSRRHGRCLGRLRLACRAESRAACGLSPRRSQCGPLHLLRVRGLAHSVRRREKVGRAQLGRGGGGRDQWAAPDLRTQEGSEDLAACTLGGPVPTIAAHRL